ncbi:MAG: glutamate--cysteine ligase, partial [Candidatus Dadabacteria bacterium]|nr:glutamate--cysteine ligase [Candidatus Dadabacteria bacterium]NIQ15015.1 glutamate--cysteine ligase [Candidatus Dadabacteria bacterium]
AKLDKFDSKTSYLPYATSLRMGDIGYNNKKESEFGFKASYDSIKSYTKSLKYAI